jgi:hypothetical protein
MLSERYGGRSGETHEQFVWRASNVFPEQQVKAWSRFERAVFNQLMAPLIHKRGYSAITNEILLELRECMDKIVLNFETGVLEG